MEREMLPLPEPLHELMGGVEPGALTNFYGPPGTGKTNVCLLIALECIRRGGKVSYIDTEGGFSPERLSQLAPDAEEVMKKISITQPRDFEQQGKAVRSVHANNPDLIILDSAVALYRLEWAEKDADTMEASRELSRQISVLSNIAREKHIPVVLTTHTYRNWDTNEHEVVGGDSIKYWSKAMVMLQRTNKMSERIATITKHRWMPEGKSVRFVITQDGIRPGSGFRLFG